LFSASAAIVGKLEYYTFDGASDAASMLSGLAAVITTLIAALDFDLNWRINRRSRADVQIIVLDSEKEDADPGMLLTALQGVIKRRIDELQKSD
jgi:hypothetical protein